METTFSNMNLKMSFPTDGAKLMKRESVSRNRQTEPTSGLHECILKDGHRCGACYNISDAKVRIGKYCEMKQISKIMRGVS